MIIVLASNMAMRPQLEPTARVLLVEAMQVPELMPVGFGKGSWIDS
jgi:hypothetical protein